MPDSQLLVCARDASIFASISNRNESLIIKNQSSAAPKAQNNLTQSEECDNQKGKNKVFPADA